MIDMNLFSLICLAGVGIFFFLIIFILPQRKLPEEKGKKLLHEERCTVIWKSLGGTIQAGGIIPSRISFYDDFFVVSLIGHSKINYSEVTALSCKSNWFSRTITFSFGKGRSLVINVKNMEKIESIIKALIK